MVDPSRKASCCCGAVVVHTTGQPIAIGMCHCLECQRRTGSVFGVQARFPKEQVRIEGQPTTYVRTGDSGKKVTFHFCSRCGTTICWQPEALPDFLSVAVGAFADPSFPAPQYSVYESREHSWAHPGFELDHYD
jgi:hypothetical protein